MLIALGYSVFSRSFSVFGYSVLSSSLYLGHWVAVCSVDQCFTVFGYNVFGYSAFNSSLGEEHYITACSVVHCVKTIGSQCVFSNSRC